MADYSQLINDINQNIKQNGEGSITGPKLNRVLREMVDTINQTKADGYTNEILLVDADDVQWRVTIDTEGILHTEPINP